MDNVSGAAGQGRKICSSQIPQHMSYPSAAWMSVESRADNGLDSEKRREVIFADFSKESFSTPTAVCTNWLPDGLLARPVSDKRIFQQLAALGMSLAHPPTYPAKRTSE
jgi:hypothetical protein